MQLMQQESNTEKIHVPELENQNVIFRPNPGPQSLFLAAPEREVLYGGAAGGRG